jgi:hypothetical protein
MPACWECRRRRRQRLTRCAALSVHVVHPWIASELAPGHLNVLQKPIVRVDTRQTQPIVPETGKIVTAKVSRAVGCVTHVLADATWLRMWCRSTKW